MVYTHELLFIHVSHYVISVHGKKIYSMYNKTHIYKHKQQTEIAN